MKTRTERISDLNAKIEAAKDRAFGLLACNEVRRADAWLAKAASLTQERDEMALSLYEAYGVTV